jgi:hypothetical protein
MALYILFYLFPAVGFKKFVGFHLQGFCDFFKSRKCKPRLTSFEASEEIGTQSCFYCECFLCKIFLLSDIPDIGGNDNFQTH